MSSPEDRVTDFINSIEAEIKTSDQNLNFELSRLDKKFSSESNFSDQEIKEIERIKANIAELELFRGNYAAMKSVEDYKKICDEARESYRKHKNQLDGVGKKINELGKNTSEKERTDAEREYAYCMTVINLDLKHLRIMAEAVRNRMDEGTVSPC